MTASGRRETEVVDRAAVLGTAMAAVVALTFGGEGEWDLLAVLSGIALLAVLAGFFTIPDRDIDLRTRRRELAALSGVAALCAALVISVPLQLFLSTATPVGADCSAAGAVTGGRLLADPESVAGAALVANPGMSANDLLARAAGDAAHRAEGVCLGAATSRWLWLPAALLGVVFYLVTYRISSRRPPPDR